MDITIQRETLLKPLQAVCGVIEKRQTLPVLSNVLLTIRDNHLFLTGTDLEIELIGFVAIESSSPTGKTTVSARKLFDICRTLPEGCTLHLSMEKNFLVVRAGESCFMLNTLPAEDFPNLDVSEYATVFSMKQGNLKNLLARTWFAMGQQDVRHYLNGAFLDIGRKAIKCVAADGHRLALATLADDAIGEAEARIILPRKSVLELMRLLEAEGEAMVKVEIGDNRAQFTTNDFIFTTKLINAQYPDYNRLVPKGVETATGDRESIKQALTRASILSNEKFRGVRVQLEPGKLRITANNSDREQADEAVSLEYAGKSMEIGFNVAYLLDVVSAISSRAIRCVFSSPNEGVLIEAADGDNSIYVVMPMRL